MPELTGGRPDKGACRADSTERSFKRSQALASGLASRGVEVVTGALALARAASGNSRAARGTSS